MPDAWFQMALYLASPALWGVLERKGFDWGALREGERLSLLRYYNRMCFRPTPFGAFASFTVAQWGDADGLRLDDRDSAKLHLNVDQELSLRLAEKIIGKDLPDMSFTSNPLLYALGNEVRFVRTLHGKNVAFEMEALPRSALTDQLFAAGLQKGTELMALIRAMSACDEEAAVDYLQFLVDAGLLLPHTGPNVVGQDYLRRLLPHSDSPLKADLSALIGAPASFPEVISRGDKLMALRPDHKGSPFYAGLERNVCSGNLDKQYQPLIRDGLDALEKLVRPVQQPMLVRFIRDFKARYDRQKIPLLQAIDPDAGIIYGALAAPATDRTLLNDVHFAGPGEPDNRVDWSAAHRLLLGKWRNSYEPIQLSDDDLRLLPDREAALPPSLPVLFRVTEEGVYIESVGGASATALIGRFTSWSNEVHELGKELAGREESANPEVIFADIGQLSDSHTDNINRRAAVYQYEIPVNVVSLLPAEQQITLADLWVSVVGEELILESRSLNKVVIPRLSSAYNYTRNNLAVFRLLCDLQYQGIQGNFSFSLEDFFPGMSFYPRVVYKQTILSPATWHLSSAMLKDLQRNWEAARYTLHLPAVITLSKADQQLVFRPDEAADVTFLLGCLKGLDHAVLQEYLLPAEIVKADGDKSLINQFITFLTREDPVFTNLPDKILPQNVQPSFMLGSRWLYLKLYVSPATANTLLTRKLLPLLKQLGETDLLSWFFIRYDDTGHHIRLRLQVREAALGSILRRFNSRFAAGHLLREYQTDTYRRELERYGADIMEKVESFFHGSSELVLAYLKASGSKFFPYNYHSLAFVSVNDMLIGFLPEQNEQLLFLKQMSHTFYTEFSGDKTLKVALDQKYRELKAEIEGLLFNKAYYSSLKLEDAAGVFSERMHDLLKVVSGFKAPRKIQLLADLIHMHLNRIFTDQQREQELIAYYCLYKHSLSIAAHR